MATIPTISIEHYLRSSYKPDMDFVDGTLVERNLGEYTHGRCKGIIASSLLANERGNGVVGLISYRIRVSPTRVRVGDLVILRANAPRERVAVTPPLLCIEIMAPQDTLQTTKLVLLDYFNIGVEHLWLIDPQSRQTYTFTAMGLHKQCGPLTVPGYNLHLDTDALFTELD